MARKFIAWVALALLSTVWFNAHAQLAAGINPAKPPPIPTTITNTADNSVIGTFAKDTQITVTHTNGTAVLKQGTVTITVPASVLKFAVQYGTPACPTLPPPETRPGDPGCPAGTHGSYTQTRTYSTAPYPQCSLVGAWLPAAPPDGTCLPDVIPPPNNSFENTFNSLYAANYNLNFDDTSNWTYTRYARPAKTANLQTPGLTTLEGTKVWRLTNRTTEATSAGTDHLRHEYSKRNPWNEDNTYYIAQDAQGFWFLYNASTLAKITKHGNGGAMTGFAGDCEPWWVQNQPHKIWHTDANGSLKWYEYDTETDTNTLLFDLTGKLPAGMTTAAHAWFKGEGRPSIDGRYFGFQLDDSNWNGLGAAMYDKQLGQFIGWCAGCSRPDHTMTSPFGNYFILGYGNDGVRGGRACLATQKVTSEMSCRKITGDEIEHGDVVIGYSGEELYVQNDYSGDDTGGYIRLTNIATGTYFKLDVATLYPGTNHSTVGTHISGIISEKHHGLFVLDFEGSCANYNNQCPDPVQRAVYDRVGIAEAKVGGRIGWVGPTQTSGATYFNEPQATSNKDGTRFSIADAYNYRDGAATSQSESFMFGMTSAIYNADGSLLAAPQARTLVKAPASVSDATMKGKRPKYDTKRPTKDKPAPTIH